MKMNSKIFFSYRARLIGSLVVAAFCVSLASANTPANERNILLAPAYISPMEFIMADTLALNASKTVTVYANKEHNWTGVKLINGQTFKFTVGSPEWNNGPVETDAEGYLMPVTPPGWVLRFPSYRLMALVGSLYTYQDKYSYTGTSFLIAKGRTWKATKTGFVAAFANDCEGCYSDNSRVVTLTIKRVE